jgi:hypothetical protein
MLVVVAVGVDIVVGVDVGDGEDVVQMIAGVVWIEVSCCGWVSGYCSR